MNYPTFYDTVIHSKEWKAWAEYLHKEALEERLHFDIDESIECGWLSENHWNAFIEFTRQETIKKINTLPRYELGGYPGEDKYMEEISDGEYVKLEDIKEYELSSLDTNK